MHGVLCLGGAEGALLGRRRDARAAGRRPEADRLPRSARAGGRSARSSARATSTVMHSVVDILGLNAISRAIFDNAAAAIAGMARDGGRRGRRSRRPSVGITMLGQTTPGVMRLRERCSCTPGTSR